MFGEIILSSPILTLVHCLMEALVIPNDSPDEHEVTLVEDMLHVDIQRCHWPNVNFDCKLSCDLLKKDWIQAVNSFNNQEAILSE